ncbi:phosphoadenylyl-sulfate reductase [Blattabacterium sp. (Cryptocercus kyebangensis)]|uniref:phosphoadenylyl-sulfate reductase n=1 Tax=Blattabacterium sp. (Cryptocercus kyebangensis) TaxID=298656 RepID=UPI000D7CB9F9|nr:phosphoadenylyl-sulfate reductase [Blattabacterium sp. (Cryptocercus kyebangensis)]AWU43707.1 phosphoadenylyl-sulfate reductase [Blattabacterium sp. (Cryptocercus kyebangensis)]
MVQYEIEKPIKKYLSDLSKKIRSSFIEEKLRTLSEIFSGKIVFSTSFNIEDQLISHFILDRKIPIKIFTLDTGRIFKETYKVWSDTNKFYNHSISAYFPDPNRLEKFLSEKGPNSFYENVKNRTKCCFLRKVEPLKRALKGNLIWITGLRSEHSIERKELNDLEWDANYNLIKYHPLFDWNLKKIEKIIKKYNIPYNHLYNKGYLSIGCAPCTRSVKYGENYRSGRWWWESNSVKKECGLHFKNLESKK